MPRPGGREGVRVGTGQRDRTATPNTLTEKREMEEEYEKEEGGDMVEQEKECSPQHTQVGITYIFITLSCTIFILDQKEMG